MKVRNSNYELMRIISMFFIVIYHCIIITGGQLIEHTTGFTQMFCEFLSLIIIVHVNSFLLISGYFQYNKQTSLKKVWKLIRMALFYSIIIALVLNFTNIINLNFLDYVKVFSPIEFSNLWFLITYIALYLLSPYINILIEKLDQKEHRNLLILLFIMFSIIPTVTSQNTFANNGHTLIQFIFMYILGAYFGKYSISKNIHFKNYTNKKKIAIFTFGFFFFGIINYLIFYISKNILLMNPGNFMTYVCNSIQANTYFYQNPLIIIQSICYFLIFENFHFENKFINYIASSVFATYIITENPYILGNLYRWVGINTGEIFDGFSIVVHMFICSIIIFVVCIIIECIRKEIIKLIKRIIIKIKKMYKRKDKKNNIKKVKVKTISVDL